MKAILSISLLALGTAAAASSLSAQGYTGAPSARCRAGTTTNSFVSTMAPNLRDAQR